MGRRSLAGPKTRQPHSTRCCTSSRSGGRARTRPTTTTCSRAGMARPRAHRPASPIRNSARSIAWSSIFSRGGSAMRRMIPDVPAQGVPRSLDPGVGTDRDRPERAPHALEAFIRPGRDVQGGPRFDSSSLATDAADATLKRRTHDARCIQANDVPPAFRAAQRVICAAGRCAWPSRRPASGRRPRAWRRSASGACAR